MIELKPSIDCDVCMTSIEMSINMLIDHRPKTRVFFVAFTPEFRVFSRETERYSNQGYDAVFWQPNSGLPTPDAWDIVMYDNVTGEAIARVSHRPGF